MSSQELATDIMTFFADIVYPIDDNICRWRVARPVSSQPRYTGVSLRGQGTQAGASLGQSEAERKQPPRCLRLSLSGLMTQQRTLRRWEVHGARSRSGSNMCNSRWLNEAGVRIRWDDVIRQTDRQRKKWPAASVINLKTRESESLCWTTQASVESWSEWLKSEVREENWLTGTEALPAWAAETGWQVWSGDESIAVNMRN